VSEDQVIYRDQLRDGGHLPGLADIWRLMDPPAIYVCHGFVGAHLHDGGTALVTCPGGGDAEVFARTGDPSPGLPGEHITEWEPPHSNSGVPDAGVCGIVSAVPLCQDCLEAPDRDRFPAW
jgi:hypothetical protein